MPPSPDFKDATLARLILESTPAVIYVYDVQSERSVYQNRKLGDLLGHVQRAEPGGPTEWQRYMHPEDAARFPEYRAQLKTITAGQTVSWEYRLRASDGAWRWFQSRDVLLSTDDGGVPLLVVGNAADITDQKSAEDRYALLEAELKHRAKNLGALIQAIGRQTRPSANPEATEHFDTLVSRLMTLVNAGNLVLASAPRVARLREILDVTLEPFLNSGPSNKFHIDGPDVFLNEQACGSIALAVHELATNALKYGALSSGNGHIRVTWGHLADRPGCVGLVWRENGGPPASRPSREGFGTRVIRQGAAGGPVDIDYQADGLSCRFELRTEPPADEGLPRSIV